MTNTTHDAQSQSSVDFFNGDISYGVEWLSGGWVGGCERDFLRRGAGVWIGEGLIEVWVKVGVVSVG